MRASRGDEPGGRALADERRSDGRVSREQVRDGPMGAAPRADARVDGRRHPPQRGGAGDDRDRRSSPRAAPTRRWRRCSSSSRSPWAGPARPTRSRAFIVFLLGPDARFFCGSRPVHRRRVRRACCGPTTGPRSGRSKPLTENGQLGRLDRHPHRAAVGERQLGDGGGRDLGHDRHRAATRMRTRSPRRSSRRPRRPRRCGGCPRAAGGARRPRAAARRRSTSPSAGVGGRDAPSRRPASPRPLRPRPCSRFTPDEIGDVARSRAGGDLGRSCPPARPSRARARPAGRRARRRRAASWVTRIRTPSKRGEVGRRSRRVSVRVPTSSAASGSSSRSRRGSVTSARASATRCA